MPTPPVEKIQKNNLSDKVSAEIAWALMRSRDVNEFVTHQEKMIPEYPAKLREAFMQEYNQLYSKGYRGDELYIGLRDYASQNSREVVRNSAAAIVLAYYFEICEVFEP